MEAKPQTVERRVALIAEKERLEGLITGSGADEKTISALRADYRSVTDELATFYDDINPNQED